MLSSGLLGDGDMEGGCGLDIKGMNSENRAGLDAQFQNQQTLPSESLVGAGSNGIHRL